MAKIPAIDYDLCIGCGHCSEVCPEVFELGDDEKSTVIGPDKCGTCNCQEAIDTCPVQAISWSG
jgi:ferredoxin